MKEEKLSKLSTSVTFTPVPHFSVFQSNDSHIPLPQPVPATGQGCRCPQRSYWAHPEGGQGSAGYLGLGETEHEAPWPSVLHQVS